MVIPLFEDLKQVIRFLIFNYCNLFMWEKHRHGWHSIPTCIPKMVKGAKTYGKRCSETFEITEQGAVQTWDEEVYRFVRIRSYAHP